jgi:hypothetical protein
VRPLYKIDLDLVMFCNQSLSAVWCNGHLVIGIRISWVGVLPEHQILPRLFGLPPLIPNWLRLVFEWLCRSKSGCRVISFYTENRRPPSRHHGSEFHQWNCRKCEVHVFLY